MNKNRLLVKKLKNITLSLSLSLFFALVPSSFAFASDLSCICATQAGDILSAQGAYKEKCEVMRGFSSSTCIKKQMQDSEVFVCTNGPIYKPKSREDIFYNNCKMSYENQCLSFSDSSSDSSWGWDGKKSCRPALSFHPSACLDIDGDGWGWNGKNSCKIPELESASSSKLVNQDSSLDLDGLPKIAALRSITTEFSEPVIGAAQSIQASPIEKEKIVKKIIEEAAEKILEINTEQSSQDAQEEVATAKEPSEIKTEESPKLPTEAQSAVFEQNFEDSILGSYSGSEVKDEWNKPVFTKGFDEGRVYIVNDGGAHRKVMRVKYPKGMFGFSGSASFPMKLPDTYEELYVAYDVKFENNFQFVKGGKLPGLCGGECNSGGQVPNGHDGWSARGMWRNDGVLENYLYHAAQRSIYGDDAVWGEQAKPGVWHRVEHRIKMNTVGKADGIVEAWLDGERVLFQDDLEFRKRKDLGIDTFYFSTFFGGGDFSWSPSEDVFINFDNFIISQAPIYSHAN